MKKVLLDTSVIVDFLRLKDKKNTLLARLIKNNYELYISIITHAELYAGKSVWKSKNALEELEVLFSGMEVLPISTKISEKSGELKAAYDTNLLDAIIAATCISHNLDLATKNIKDFSKIINLNLLQE